MEAGLEGGCVDGLGGEGVGSLRGGGGAGGGSGGFGHDEKVNIRWAAESWVCYGAWRR